MICPKCHAHNNYYHQYCHQCGAKLSRAVDEQAPGPDTMANQVIFNQGTTRRKRRGHLRVGLLALCGGLVLAAAAWMLPKWNLMGEAMEGVPSPAAGSSPYPTVQSLETPPPLTLEILDPVDGWFTCDEEQCEIRIRTNAQSLWVNDDPVQSEPDDGGEWVVLVTLPDYGVNPVILTAAGTDGQSVTSRIPIYRRYPDVPMTLADGQSLTTDTGSLTLTGTVLPGSFMAVSTVLACGAPLVDEEGRFSLQLSFPVIPGQYDITLILSAPGHEDTRCAWTLTRTLDEQAYADAGTDCGFDTLRDNPDAVEGTVIRIKGVVDEVLKQSDHKTFTFFIGGHENEAVLVEYTGQTAMEPGDRRTLYGEYTGTQQDMPKVLVRLGYRR